MQAEALEQQEAPTHVPTKKLSNGVDIPLMGFGTWQLSKAEAEAMVRGALKMASPVSIDTSPDYRNHDAVKAALRDTPRDSYFLTTKVNPTDQFNQFNAFSKTMDQLTNNLKELGTPHLDLALIHFPVNDARPKSLRLDAAEECKVHQAMWKAMEFFYKQGKARAIGVSNFYQPELDCILPKANVVPHVNQVSFHVGQQGGCDPEGIRTYLASKNIHLQAYSPLGSPRGVQSLLLDPALRRIAKAHQQSPASVAHRWILQHQASVLTTTTNPQHMREALDAFSFELSYKPAEGDRPASGEMEEIK